MISDRLQGVHILRDDRVETINSGSPQTFFHKMAYEAMYPLCVETRSDEWDYKNVGKRNLFVYGDHNTEMWFKHNRDQRLHIQTARKALLTSSRSIEDKADLYYSLVQGHESATSIYLPLDTYVPAITVRKEKTDVWFPTGGLNDLEAYKGFVGLLLQMVQFDADRTEIWEGTVLPPKFFNTRFIFLDDTSMRKVLTSRLNDETIKKYRDNGTFALMGEVFPSTLDDHMGDKKSTPSQVGIFFDPVETPLIDFYKSRRDCFAVTAAMHQTLRNEELGSRFNAQVQYTTNPSFIKSLYSDTFMFAGIQNDHLPPRGGEPRLGKQKRLEELQRLMEISLAYMEN